MAVFVLRVDGFDLVVHSVEATETVYLQERFKKLGAKPIDLGKGYVAVKHPAHVPGCQEHLHVTRRKDELFALNVDGSAHDQSHGAVIPGHVVKRLEQHFPDFAIPEGGRIAGLDPQTPNERALVAGLTKYASSSPSEVMFLETEPEDNVDKE